MEILATILMCLVFALVLQWVYIRHKNYELKIAVFNANSAISQLKNLQTDYNNLVSSRKSSETRLGLIAEQLAPILDAFPIKDTQDIHFFGQPIDYIAFNDEGVHFIEIKSGNARLSPKQARIKEQIQNGNVFWHVMRIK